MALTRTPGEQVTEASITASAQASAESNFTGKAKCAGEEESFSGTVLLTLLSISITWRAFKLPHVQTTTQPFKSEFLGVVPRHPHFIKLPRGFQSATKFNDRVLLLKVWPVNQQGATWEPVINAESQVFP